jgi:YfiH family protein
MLEQAAAIEALGGLVHGFTDREGGTSKAGFAGLNLGRKWGDDPTCVDENLRRVGGAAGFRPADLLLVHQVHGADVLRARDLRPDSQADALWLHRDDGPGVVGVLTADCVPVLLADAARTVVAAVHSGWRGAVAGVVPAAVSTLAAIGVEPASLRAAIGPCIEWPAFEVGPEVAVQFPKRHVRRAGLSRPHVDLVGVVREQLEAAGVLPSYIERVGGCTHADPQRYFSYRRDGPRTGQQLSFIGFAHGS